MKKLENERAKLKGVQADVFFQLKLMIEFYSIDERLREIIKQPYFKRNYDKFIVGIDGEKCFGVVDNIDLEKRDSIVREVVDFLLDEEDTIKDTQRKWCEFSLLATMYFQIDEWLQKVTIIRVLKKHIENAQIVLRTSREFIDSLKFSKN